METTTMRTTIKNPSTQTTPTKPRRVCFSFAAYSKNVIDHFKSCNIPITDGLTDTEFAHIEASFHFSFPPDLRSILCEGLPVGPGFPNWRSSSIQQLEILMNLPILGISKEVGNGRFWCETWGEEPVNREEAVAVARRILGNGPVLVPIYRHCYIPSDPTLAGNPVFYINGGDVRYSGFDVAGFFQQIEFREKTALIWPIRLKKSSQNSVKAPPWAATMARKIEVWSDLVENGTSKWENGTCERWRNLLGDYFEEISWRLRDGGWEDEEVMEMMMMPTMDGRDEAMKKKRVVTLRDGEGVVLHVRFLSLILIRAGWSMDDVIYALGFNDKVFPNLESWLDTWNLDFKAPENYSSL